MAETIKKCEKCKKKIASCWINSKYVCKRCFTLIKYSNKGFTYKSIDIQAKKFDEISELKLLKQERLEREKLMKYA